MGASIQCKRANAARWMELNLVLEDGEPGFERDTHRFKIGDGKTAWKDLPYVNGNGGGQLAITEIVIVDIYQHLPLIGDETKLYRVSAEKALYQWNTTESKYESLTSGGDFDPGNIKFINGGNANG